jgi:hypothetical protein
MGISGGNRLVAFARIVSPVGGDAANVLISRDLVQKFWQHGSIWRRTPSILTSGSPANKGRFNRDRPDPRHDRPPRCAGLVHHDGVSNIVFIAQSNNEAGLVEFIGHMPIIGVALLLLLLGYGQRLKITDAFSVPRLSSLRIRPQILNALNLGLSPKSIKTEHAND